MVLTIVQAKDFLKDNANDILKMASSDNSIYMNIMSAIYHYNRAQNVYTERLVIEAAEAYIEEKRKKEGV